RLSARSAFRAARARRMVRLRGRARRGLSRDLVRADPNCVGICMNDESRSMPSRSLASSSLQAIGWLSLPGIIALASRLVYEQTVLTWGDGMQAVGLSRSPGGVPRLLRLVMSFT